ncbi:MAG: putative peptidoglycan glycosyltransferase FtsW [Candidatus Eisenbacteria bacterium]
MDEHGMDRYLLFAVITLTLVGLVMVYSSSYIIAQESPKARDAAFFLRRHVIRVVLGFILMYMATRMNESAFRRIAKGLLLLSLGLLVLVLLPTPLRLVVRGSARWIKLGYFSFQPSDVARIALILYIADFCARKGREIKSFKHGFLPPFIMLVIAAALVAREPNISTAAMLLMIGSVVLFIGGARLAHVIAGFGTCASAMALIVVTTGYNLERIRTFFSGSVDSAASYHVRQSLIAVGVGGIKGLGVGMSNQKYLFLPDAHTDFVFAIAAEELGLLGMLGIMALFFVFVWRGLKVARNAPTVFSSLIASGITVATAAYFCVSACVCTGIVPTAGLPLPFLSYGGSSSLILLASCGILLGISKRKPTYLDFQPARWRNLIR